MSQLLFLFSLFGWAVLRPMHSSLERLNPQGCQAENGQGLVEYALILVLVALVVIIVVALYGNSVENLYNYTINRLVDTFTGSGSP